ncbi:MAG: CHAT domain-containing protein [Cyanobacteria bacterium P01_F01_bin.150]
MNSKWIRRFVQRYLSVSCAIATLLWAFATFPAFPVPSLAGKSLRDFRESNVPSLRRMGKTKCAHHDCIDGHVLSSFAHPTPGILFSSKSLGTHRYRSFAKQLAETPTDVSLLDHGLQHYQAGQLQQAVTLWQQVATHATDWQQQVTALNYLGLVYQDLGQWSQANEVLANALAHLDAHDAHDAHDATESQLYADVLTTQGSWQLHQGQAQQALETWRTAEQLYPANTVEQRVQTQINQAQALRSLGFYRQALDVLEGAIATPLSNNVLKARSLHSLGITLRTMGQLERSQAVLEQALTLIPDSRSPISKHQQSSEQLSVRGRIQMSLAHTLRDAGHLEMALASYQQVAQLPLEQRLLIEVALQQIALHHKLGHSDVAAQLIEDSLAQLESISPSRWGIYAQINLAEQMLAEQILGDEEPTTDPVALRLLVRAVQQSRALDDKRAEAYALAQLGHRYEQARQFTDALSLTNQALSLANGLQAQEIAVSLYWQQGRLRKQLGDETLAIEAYSQAVKGLEALGQDLVAVNPEIQFSYRDQVEPIYRQLVQLFLNDIDQKAPAEQQQRLEQSRNVIEALQLAELQNYFREACQTYEAQSIDEIDPLAAVVYPIQLTDRLEVIVSVPGQPLHHYGSALSEAVARQLVQTVSSALNPTSRPTDVLVPAQQLYDRLLRPAEPFLENTQTLVFVLDGFLRNLPMAVLHDGQQFLLEKYRLALTPGLQLLPGQQLQSDRLQMLTGGISEARQGFSALPGVQEEISQVATSVSSAKVLLNQQFTRGELQSQLNRTPFSVVHFATHGQFSSNAADTFLLTWNDRLQFNDIEQLLTQHASPIELLVLSACETAAGDNRAALGMAGVAVRSGARSTLATLWPVQDDSTAGLTTTFYQLLRKGAGRADALQQAQQQLLRSTDYQHPFYWAPYVLVGNWQ